MNLSTIMIRPIVTEKAMAGSRLGRYVFEVDRRAGKPQIKMAIERQFGVSVARVNTSLRKGKSRRSLRTRRPVALPPTKKAMVTLKHGQSIAALDITVEKEGSS